MRLKSEIRISNNGHEINGELIVGCYIDQTRNEWENKGDGVIVCSKKSLFLELSDLLEQSMK